MFDLFRSRDKAVRILLGALLVVVALSMLTYLVPNYNNGNNTSDLIVAEVGKEVITVYDAQRLIQNAMRGRQLPPDILPNFIPQMIDQLITERAMAYQAARMGFEVTDAQVAGAIRQYVPNLFPDGKFVGKDMYASFLSQQNLRIDEFEADMKRQLLVARLRDVALEGTIVTPLEVEQQFKKKYEKAKVEYVKIASDKYKSEAQPTPPEMETYFKTNAAKYTMPEKRNLSVLIADQTKIDQSVTVSDADLQRAYTQNQSAFRVPETVKVRHILLMTQGKPPAEEATIKAKADDLLKQIRGGANFGELVKKYSEDPGKATNNGEYSVQRDSEMMPEFKQTAFDLKPGESGIAKTAYGFHIMQVMQHDQARIKPFEEVKTELATQMKKSRVGDIMQQISDKAQSNLQKDPTHPEKVAADLNMQLVKVENLEPGKTIPEVGISSDFDQAIAGLKKGEVSPAVAVAANKLAVAVVTDVTPARPATLDEVRERVKDDIINSRLPGIVQNRAAELLEKAKSMNGDLGKAAKAMGLEMKTSEEFTRSGNIEGLGAATYVTDAFTRPEGSLLGPISIPEGAVIAKVVTHVPADMSKLAEERVAIRDEIKSQKGRDRNAIFEAGLREALIKEGKIKYHRDVISRLVNNYKS